MVDSKKKKQAKKQPGPDDEDFGVSTLSNQLNWFDLESKCKKLTYDIMQPLMQRQVADHQQIEVMEKTMKEEYEKRIADIEFFILKKRRNQKDHPTLIDLCNNRLSDLEKKNLESFKQVDEKY